MLLPDNIHPEYSIYYNGGFVLKVLQEQKKAKNIIDLYQSVKKERDMTFPIFILCLDWLFLLNAAIMTDDGVIELCS